MLSTSSARESQLRLTGGAAAVVFVVCFIWYNSRAAMVLPPSAPAPAAGNATVLRTSAAAGGTGIEAMMRRIVLSSKRAGVTYSSVLDAGANHGDWSRDFQTLFPECKTFNMVEANPLQKEAMEEMNKVPGMKYEIALLGDEDKDDVPFFSRGADTGASMFMEQTTYYKKDVTKHLLPMRKLDTLFAGKTFEFIKMDVQGAELPALRGAQRLLKSAKGLLLELSLVSYNKGSPMFGDVVAFLNSVGWQLIDLHPSLRTDTAIIQADVFFVPKDSVFITTANKEVKNLGRSRWFWEKPNMGLT